MRMDQIWIYEKFFTYYVTSDFYMTAKSETMARLNTR